MLCKGESILNCNRDDFSWLHVFWLHSNESLPPKLEVKNRQVDILASYCCSEWIDSRPNRRLLLPRHCMHGPAFGNLKPLPRILHLVEAQGNDLPAVPVLVGFLHFLYHNSCDWLPNLPLLHDMVNLQFPLASGLPPPQLHALLHLPGCPHDHTELLLVLLCHLEDDPYH